MSTPRVNSKLPIGRTVRLVGTIVRISGTQALLEASDQGQVTVNLLSGSKLSLNSTVEVLGRVEQNSSVTEMDSTVFVGQYDRDNYEAMLKFTQQYPQVFGWA